MAATVYIQIVHIHMHMHMGMSYLVQSGINFRTPIRTIRNFRRWGKIPHEEYSTVQW